jgi:DmsE family decaheme c-type cytochrome
MLRSVRSRTAFHVTTLFAIPLVILVFLAPGSAQQAGSKPDSSKQTKKYERPTDASLYVGSEVCKTCHEDMPSKGFYKTYEDSPHFVTTLDTKKGPEWHGCEACHGPGKAHVDGGGDVTKIFAFKNAAPEETSARCLDCHRNREEQSNYSRSAHLQSGVACIDCHSPHNPKDSQFLLKESSPKLCYSCHLDVRAQFARPFHHRVNEGLIQCNDCHNPHGGFEQKQLRTAIGQDEVCYKCHTDKQGPWVYQHEAKIEGCTVCHTPHGSTNQRMLQQNQVNLLCLGCHALPADIGPPGTPTFHNQAQKYQACTLCHTAIHGSNSNRFFFTP